jgi:nucleoid-associated protein YgaU
MTSDDEDQAENEPEAEPKPAGRRTVRIPIKVLRTMINLCLRLLRALGSLLWYMMVRYPRHSLAAVASVAILVAIEYTQWRGAKNPPVNQISGTQALSSQSGTGTAGNQTASTATAANDRKPKGRDSNPADTSPKQPGKPDSAAAAAETLPPAPASAATALGGSLLSSASQPNVTTTDHPLPPAPPEGQKDRTASEKAELAKTESAVVSAPGLVAATEALPPAPDSSLGKDGATLLASSAEPPPPPGSGKEQGTKEDGKSAAAAPALPEVIPAPLPSATIPGNVPEDGNAAKPAPTPDGKQPEPIGPPATLPLESLPAATAKAADPPTAASSTPLPPASGQTPTAAPLPPIEAPPPVAAPAATAAVPLSGSEPGAQHDRGSPDHSHDPAKTPATSLVQQGKATPNLLLEPAAEPGLTPDPGSIAGSPAAPGSIPQGSHEGDVPPAPKSKDGGESSSQLSPTGERSQEAGHRPAETQAPISHSGLPQSPDTPVKPEHGQAQSEGAAAAVERRAESRPDPVSPAVTEVVPPGWVAIRNSGKVPLAAGDEVGSRASDGDSSTAGSHPIRDSRAHAAKDMSFEMESPRSRASLGNLEAGLTQGISGQSRAAAGARRVETVPHVVEENENFWTISRQYYGSGRYYRALWKANADRCPQIDGLSVKDVIIIPPPEDLDPSFIDPPGDRSRSARAGREGKPSGMPGARSRRRGSAADASETANNSSGPLAGEAPPSRRGVASDRDDQESRTDDGVPIRRSSRRSSELELPAAATDPIFARDRRPVERRADSTVSQGDDDEGEARPARRSRSANFDSSNSLESSPVHKVRPNETLRSIARDTLGSARRANEILDLNRDIIDDPSNLIVGQELKLPEDARSPLRRRVSRD